MNHDRTVTCKAYIPQVVAHFYVLHYPNKKKINRILMYLFLYFLGNLKRIDTRLQLHGLGLSTSVYDRCRSLIHPFSCSIDLETIWAPHSRDLYVRRYVVFYVLHSSMLVYICTGERNMYSKSKESCPRTQRYDSVLERGLEAVESEDKGGNHQVTAQN